ncbi:hypothetical protein DINM_007363 [Dirofilaria immitis]|nr:hypothetical protein [Dirofilaria immitis]
MFSIKALDSLTGPQNELKPSRISYSTTTQFDPIVAFPCSSEIRTSSEDNSSNMSHNSKARKAAVVMRKNNRPKEKIRSFSKQQNICSYTKEYAFDSDPRTSTI